MTEDVGARVDLRGWGERIAADADDQGSAGQVVDGGDDPAAAIARVVQVDRAREEDVGVRIEANRLVLAVESQPRFHLERTAIAERAISQDSRGHVRCSGFGRRKRERSALRRGHGPLLCRAQCHSEKRTDFCPHPFAPETGAAFDIDSAASPRIASMNRRLPGQLSSKRSSKSGQVCVRTLSPRKPACPHVEATTTIGQPVDSRAFAERLPRVPSKKADRFVSAPCPPTP
jgi:hypothetical protein